ncbi:MAG: 30S ribosomal protein S17 [Candidatus Micrarchaeaceae archaeon]
MECNDPHCAIHGHISTRGVELIGRVVSGKAKKTVIVEREHVRRLYKYERYLRTHSRIAAHNPDCIGAKVGDIVKIAETRKISKTKSFVVVGIIKRAG